MSNEKKPLPIVVDNLLLCSEEACPLFEEDMGPGWARFCTAFPRAELNTALGETVCLPGIKLEHIELTERRALTDQQNAEYEFVLSLVNNPPELTEEQKAFFKK